jgi:hypothetical protein
MKGGDGEECVCVCARVCVYVCVHEMWTPGQPVTRVVDSLESFDSLDVLDLLLITWSTFKLCIMLVLQVFSRVGISRPAGGLLPIALVRRVW